MTAVEFRFTETVMERRGLSAIDATDLEVGVSATLELRVADRIMFREFMVPIVELRIMLLAWLRRGYLELEPFDYESVESAEVGWIWLHYDHDPNQWRIGSTRDDFPDEAVVDGKELVSAINAFMETLTGGSTRTCTLKCCRIGGRTWPPIRGDEH